jgi:hypothetical protein
MRAVVDIPVAEVRSDLATVLRAQGLPEGYDPDPRVTAQGEEALDFITTLCTPRGVYASLDQSAFAEVFAGQGNNAPETPVAAVYPRAEHLALFAVTLGPAVSTRIEELFARHEFALAALLDAAASEAAELAAAALEQRYVAALIAQGAGKAVRKAAFLSYSPGYCGWDMSGQAALFAALRPDEIGIRLRESFLMEPLKSITGVLLGGPAAIHAFWDGYPFCTACESRDCRERIRRVLTGRADGA